MRRPTGTVLRSSALASSKRCSSCEAATILEETERTARRVLGGAHPLTAAIEQHLRAARAALRVRETPSPRRTSSAQQVVRSVRIQIGEPIPSGDIVGPAVLMFAFTAVAIFLYCAWDASTASAPRAPEL